MRTHTRTTTTALALALAVAMGGCTGGGGEPTDSTSTASGPSDSTSVDETKAEEDGAVKTFNEYWQLANAANPSEPPNAGLKAIMTTEAYDRDVEFAEGAPKLTVEGRDKLTASKAKVKWTTGGPTATVEVCYTVGKKFLADEKITRSDGTTIAKGSDIRTDQNGDKIKAGSEMVNLVTLKRDRDKDAPWQVDSTEVGAKENCDIKGIAS